VVERGVTGSVRLSEVRAALEQSGLLSPEMATEKEKSPKTTTARIKTRQIKLYALRERLIHAIFQSVKQMAAAQRFRPISAQIM